MPETRDGYAEWLGIQTPTRPLTHYQLLGLPDFEGAQSKISAAADAAMARVRQHRPGPRAAEWQEVLDQISMAKLVLCNGARKGQYDGQLRSKLGGGGLDSKRPAGDASGSRAATNSAAPSNRGAGAKSAPAAPRSADPPAPPPGATDYAMPPLPGAPLGPGAAFPGAGIGPPPAASYSQPPEIYSQPPQPQAATYGAAAYPPNHPRAAAPEPYGAGSYAAQPASPQPYQQPNLGSSYPPETYPPPAYPQQGSAAGYYPPPAEPTPQQGQYYPSPYPQQGYSQPGYAPTADVPRTYAPQGYAPQDYPPQGYAPQSYSPTGYPPAGYAPAGYSPNVPGGLPPGGHSGLPPSGYAADPSAGFYGGQAPADPRQTYGAPEATGYSPQYAVPANPQSPAPGYSYPVSSPTAPSYPGEADAESDAEYDDSPDDFAPAETASAPRPGADGVIVRPSIRPQPVGPSQETTKLKPGATNSLGEGMSLAQRKTMFIACGVAAALLVLVIVMTNPSAPAPNPADSSAAADRPNHLNPLGTRDDSGPAGATGKAGAKSHGKPAATDDDSGDDPPAKSKSIPAAAPIEVERPAAKARTFKTNPPAAMVEEEDEPATSAPMAANRIASRAEAPATGTVAVAAGSRMENPPKPPAMSAAAKNAMPAGAKQTSTPEQAAALEKELSRARGALAGRDFAQAHEAVELAARLAVTPEEDENVKRVSLLTRYVEGFWVYVRKSMAGQQATDELKIGSTTVSVVSADEKEIVLHRAGRNDTYTVENMPAGLALTLAERYFDAKPVNKIYVGAFQAVEPNCELAEARRLWSEATRGGASAETLMPLLDTPRVPPLGGGAASGAASAGGGKLDKNSLSLAEKAVMQKFGPDVRAATNIEKKLELSRRLADDSNLSDEPAEKTALFHLACKLLAEASQKAPNPAAAAQVVEQGFDLLDEAIEQKRLDDARLVGSSLSIAARKSKDEKLIKEAAQRNRGLAGSSK